MEIILLEDVEHLGSIGQIVKVKPGHARNHLLPKKLAVLASAKKRRQIEHALRLANYRQQKIRSDSELLAKRLQDELFVTIAVKVGSQDRMFGSVTSHDIEAALAKQGVQVDRRKIHIEDPIKALGEYHIAVKLPGNVEATIRLHVVAESSD